MAALPYDLQKMYHFLREHPGWDLTYHEAPRIPLVGRIPGRHRSWLELRHFRRQILVKIGCDRTSIDALILKIAAIIERDPNVGARQLRQQLNS